MKNILTTAVVMVALTAPAFAAGDSAAGAKEFRKCKACHSITAPDGTKILKGGRVGPNLYAVVGRAAGSEDFKYSKIMTAAAAAGLVWDADNLPMYFADPNGFLSEIAGESGHAKMPKQKLKAPEDIIAYLESVVQ